MPTSAVPELGWRGVWDHVQMQVTSEPKRIDSFWIRPGHAYPGWGWVLAGAGLWLAFALLLLVLGELQREFDRGLVTRAAAGYYATSAAALLVAVCAGIRRPWAHQLVIVTSAPMLLLFPIGTVVAAMAMRALFRNSTFFAAIGRSSQDPRVMENA